jgi:hypothetical protein
MILVTTIADNVVQDSFSFEDVKMAETIFADLVAHYDRDGLCPEEMQDALDDGYCECDSGYTVCIHHPDSDFNNDFLMSLRSPR